LNLYAIIMAGGSGTRFWPLSRRRRPKQFLPIISERTMIEETAARLDPLIPTSRIFTIAGADHTRIIRELVPDIPSDNLLVEPRGRNTAPSLLLATAAIYRRDPEAVVAALPADHLIRDGGRFRERLASAAEAAAANDLIVTFGIPPTFPATGYGYIRFSREEPLRAGSADFRRVLEFKEKPDEKRALEFLRAGTYFWNSGMFLWKAKTFARMLETYAPDMFKWWTAMLTALDDGSPAAMTRIFEGIPSISIDYALMEKAEGIVMGEGDFGWSDVGSWSSLSEIWDADDDGNSGRGRLLALDARNCLVFNPNRLTTLIGVEDLVVVETDDALLICRRDQDQEVKTAVQALERADDDDHL